MKKNLLLMLSLSAIVLLAGCGNKDVVNPDATDTENWVIEAGDNQGSSEDAINPEHPEWVATSLSVSDLERIEETMPPLSYSYETYDMQANSVVNSGTFTAEWDEKALSISEYETMVNREVISSGIEDDMIYTLTNVTLEDGSVLQVLYVNEPDTLFCRAISVQNGDLNTLYSNFVYDVDIQ